MRKNLSIPHLLSLSLLLTCLFLKGSVATSNTSALLLPATPVEYRPLEGGGQEMNMMANDPFQLCLSCRCCAATDPTNCASMSCCFGIDCNLPDKPYGVCAFVPTACSCTSCPS